MARSKTKRITFRIEEQLYNFLKDFSMRSNQSVSDTIRNILIYFQYGIAVDEFKKSFSELREEYLRKKKQKK